MLMELWYEKRGLRSKKRGISEHKRQTQSDQLHHIYFAITNNSVGGQHRA